MLIKIHGTIKGVQAKLKVKLEAHPMEVAQGPYMLSELILRKTSNGETDGGPGEVKFSEWAPPKLCLCQSHDRFQICAW